MYLGKDVVNNDVSRKSLKNKEAVLMYSNKDFQLFLAVSANSFLTQYC